jgi:predicted PurR-regulated permease PerM
VRWLDETIPGLLSAAPAATATSQPSNEIAASRPAADAVASRPTTARNDKERLTKLASEHGLTIGRSLVGYLTRFVQNALYWLSLTVLLPLYTFFFLLKFNEFTKLVRDHLPADYRDTIVRVATTIDAAIASFFRGRLLVCLAVGAITGIGWLCLGWFGIRVPYNLALGALVGVLNLIPFMSVLALPPVLILTYLATASSGGNWVIALTLVAAVYMAAQAVESFVLNPTILAKASGLHAVTTVIALLIGAQVAGLLGMLLAIPVASTLKSLIAEYVMPEIRRIAQLKEEEAAKATDGTPPPDDSSPEMGEADAPPSQDGA